jgi:hypothetical protein
MRAPWVPDPWISKRTLAEKLARVYDQPYYVQLNASHDKQEPVRRAPVRAIAAESVPLAAPMKDVTPQQARIPEVLPPEEPSDTEEPDEYDLFR